MKTVKTTDAKPLLLLFPFEQLAHYLRCLTLAKQLATHFEIRVAYSPRYAAFVAQEDLETFDCPGMNVDLVLDCVKRFDFSWINRNDLEAALQNQIAAIETWRPAIVLGDAVPTLNMAAEKTGVPYVSLMNGYMSKHYAGLRNMSWRHPLYKYFQFLPNYLAHPCIRLGEKQTFEKIHQPFRELRQQHGLLKKRSYADELEGDLNLLCDLPELFPQTNLPAHYQFIPPLLYEANTTCDVPNENRDAAKQTLFVSMGSTGDWQQVCFLNEPLFQKYNIITAGDKTGVLHGPHITALAFVNATKLFAHVDLVLCHGGNGTIYQALQAAIPALCKTAHFEQEWNVQALEKHGLGASLDGVKTAAAHMKLIEAWIGKKGSAPLRFMQQRLAAATAAEPVATHLLNLLPATETVYYEAEKKSA